MTTPNLPRGRSSILFSAAVSFLLFQPTATTAQENFLPNLEIVFEENRASVELTASDLDNLTQHTITTHSPYYKGEVEFSGPKLVDVLSSVADTAVEDNARISLHALNNYFVRTTIGDLKGVDALLATRKHGERLSIRERGPFWIILPLSDRQELDSEQFHRLMVWQLHKVGVGE